MKLIDEALLSRFRKTIRCEYCLRVSRTVASHIYTRGAGRVDIAENLCSLCPTCETHHHAGAEPTTARMETIAALREGIHPEDIKAEVDRIRAMPKPNVAASVKPVTAVKEANRAFAKKMRDEAKKRKPIRKNKGMK